jgi:CheY-like chemotaxis protein
MAMHLNKHILIVDDFKDDREMYGHYLTHFGFQVSEAADGEGALVKAMRIRPDLILMDLALPRLTGWEAIRQLRSDNELRRIPIIVLTARSFVEADAIDCEGCLIKPCRPDDLLVEVMRVLGIGLGGRPEPKVASPPRELV